MQAKGCPGIQLSIVIVSYNVRHFLEQALQAVLKAAQNMEVEIFVVDNNSVDGSPAMVRQKFPQVELLAMNENLGFAKANNLAIRRAKGQYILLLNPDTLIAEDSLQKCYQFMEEHPEAGGLGVRMIDGTGIFLPESKRGFPSPFVAFCKTFGLSRLFPRSPLFNRYHLGFLSENETHEVDVLSGAYMWLRRSVLEEIGLLDERFFMYGEDIDLSYRIVQAGYKNYYFADTTIIHYKGESTRKGSLNYVRIFYQAMVLFAEKHFRGRKARWYIAFIHLAIYFRALVSLSANAIRRIWLPLLDTGLIAGGMLFLKNFWARYHFHNPDYYPDTFYRINLPVYLLFWLGGAFFGGAYDRPYKPGPLIRGLLFGSLLLMAAYGFFPQEYRFSRALILMGTAWALLSTLGLRLLLHFSKEKNFKLFSPPNHNYLIIGSKEESRRVRELLHLAKAEGNYIGTVLPEAKTLAQDQPSAEKANDNYLGQIDRLDEMVRIFKVDELIFCSRDLPAERITWWMSKLGPSLNYRIAPEKSLSIIGSHSKNLPGDLYTIEVQFAIVDPRQKRFKRLLDLSLALAFFPLALFQILQLKLPFRLWAQAWQVLRGKKSWIGYAGKSREQEGLPPLKPGLCTPADALGNSENKLDSTTLHRLNFFYAKDYRIGKDLEILWRCLLKKNNSTTSHENSNKKPS